jgi:signal peptidase I
MPRLQTFLEWSAILIPLIIIGFFVYNFIFSAPTAEPSGLPGNGGFFQVPLVSSQQYSKSSGDWSFILVSDNAYTLAGKVVGRHEYPATMPDGIIALDLAVVNGDILANDNLQYFTFTMGDRTLKYSYDVPTYTGLTEEYIDEHVSNNHLVFLNPALESEVKKAKSGGCLIIKGKLVDIRGSSPQKQFLVNTSTVRNDAYPAGCEIILVESFTPVSCGN